MPRPVKYLLAAIITVLLAGGPFAFEAHRKAQLRNFRVVHPGILYRSGQLRLDGLRSVVHDHGIRTVISLRDRANGPGPTADSEEEDYCTEQDILFVRIPPRPWWAPTGEPPAQEGVRRFLEVLDDPANYPVLVHCYAGIHRTGAFCAIYRMEYERWPKARALAEMVALGYSSFDDEEDIQGFLEQYVPRWQRQPPTVAAAPAAVGNAGR